MANKKISELTSGNPAQSSDILPIDRSGSNFSVTAGSIAALSGGSFDVAGQGFFWGGSSFGPPSANAPTITGVSNQVRAAQLILLHAITVRKISIKVGSNTVGASHACCAIYTADGNTKLLDAGTNAFDTSISGTSNQTVTITPVTLQPGVYLFAWSDTDTSPSLNYGSQFASITSLNTVMNANAVRVGTAVNAMSGGAMPSTLGVLTAGVFDIAGFLFET